MLRITSVSAGAVDYLLRGSGCAEHEHAGEAPGQGSGRGGGRTADAVDYLLAGAAVESAGVWGGAGLSMLGVQAGTAATEDQVRAVFGRFRASRGDSGVVLGVTGHGLVESAPCPVVIAAHPRSTTPAIRPHSEQAGC